MTERGAEASKIDTQWSGLNILSVVSYHTNQKWFHQNENGSCHVSHQISFHFYVWQRDSLTLALGLLASVCEQPLLTIFCDWQSSAAFSISTAQNWNAKKRQEETTHNFEQFLQVFAVPPALDIVTSWTSGARHLRHVDFDFERKKERPLWFKIHSTLKSNPLSFNLCSGWFLVLMRRSPRAILFLQRRLADHCRHAGYPCRVCESLTASEKTLLNP